MFKVQPSALTFGIGLILFSFSSVFTVSLTILGVVGCAWMVLVAGCNTALQSLSDDKMRGRVMSLFSMMLVGMRALRQFDRRLVSRSHRGSSG
jgi:hypothetical protein